MSPDLFPKYLKDPSLLYRISYEELKTMVLAYPYCQNLRYLLLMKSQLIDHPEQERNLQMASAYTLNRTQLYQAVKQQAQSEDKDLAFLDLQQQSEEEETELELPILDFSQQDLSDTPTGEILHDTENEEEQPAAAEPLLNLTEEFDMESFILPSKRKKEAVTDEETIPVPSRIAEPLVPPLVDILLARWEKAEEEQETHAALVTAHLPYRIQVDVPPPFPTILPITPQEEQTATEEQETAGISLPLPLVPPLVDDFNQKLAADIDRKVEQALSRLAELQKKELAAEEQAEEERLTALIKQEILAQHQDVVAEETPPTPKGPMPKTSFSSWLKQMKAPQPGKVPTPKSEIQQSASPSTKNTQREKLLMKAVKAKKKEIKREASRMLLLRKRKVMELAERSLNENTEIISDTLAKILVSQGKMDKAAAMYRQLMLKFPKKSSYFAAELEKISQ